ncbi:MAG TPA: hypothetical protein V6C76_11635 [Drouetiella sp.]
MKNLLFSLALGLVLAVPVHADTRSAVLRTRDAAVEIQQAKLKNYVSDNLPEWVQKHEQILMDQAKAGQLNLHSTAYFEGNHEKTLVPCFKQHFLEQGWNVQVNEQFSRGDWIVLEISE